MAYNRDLDNGRKIFARLDDPKVRDIVNSWIDEIVYGLITVIHIFNPACIVLGGGVMAQPYILNEVKQKADQDYEQLPQCRAVSGATWQPCRPDGGGLSGRHSIGSGGTGVIVLLMNTIKQKCIQYYKCLQGLFVNRIKNT